MNAAAVTGRNRLPVFALLAGNGVSMVGNILTMMAVPWFVLQTTGSAAKTGLTGFAAVVPMVLAAFIGGAIVDRLGFKPMSIIADLASGITVAMIPLLHHTIGLQFWQLLVLVFLSALLDAPGMTARQSLVPDLAELAQMPLERVNALFQGVQRGSTLLGPVLGGLLIAALGASNVLWIDAASFGVSALMVALAVPGPVLARRTPVQPATQQGGFGGELLQGLAFIRRSRLLVSLLTFAAITNFLDGPIFSVVLPVYARDVFGDPVKLGMLLSAFGGGAVAGVLLYAVAGTSLPRRGTFLASFILVGLPIWVLSQTPGLVLSIAALALAGLAAGPLNPIMATVLQERVPAELRGRVFGSVAAMTMIAMPFGMLVQGALLQRYGVGTTLMLVAGAYLLITVGMLFNPALREMDGAPDFAPDATSLA